MEPADASDALAPPSLRTFLHAIIDYAGYFPPADLSLRRALQNYADYRSETDAWMLARFVLPVRLLPDLAPHQRLFTEGDPYYFSVLGTGGDDPGAFLDAFDRDLDVIDAFDDEYGGQGQVDVMEVPLPDALVGSNQSEVESFLSALHQRLVASGTAKLDLFLELPVASSPPAPLRTICAAAAEHNSQQAVPPRCTVGLKMRCGGAAPSDVPSAARAAAFIAACRDAGVAFKATAGLHHPLRHYDDGLDTEMHGFLNVFGTAALASEHGFETADLQRVLLDENPDHFQFLKEAFGWRDHTVSLDGLRHARETLAVSFGSCSFEEPLDHLREMELL